jgi:hypothetical protein
MDAESRTRQVLTAAVLKVLRPLVRILLRHGMPFAAFQEMAKRAYVDVAFADFALPGKRSSISRASILTGLTRKEVQRLLGQPADDGAPTADRYNRASRVLTGWIRDPDFLDAAGEPRALDGAAGFGALVRRHSGDMPARAVLDELLRTGAVRQRDDGCFEPVARAFIPRLDAVEKLGILGSDVADLVDTIDHNLEHGASDPRFQRKVMYQSIDAQALPEFRRLGAAQAQALLEILDRWLATHDGQSPGGAESPRARVGLGIYYFEERSGGPAAEGAPE